MRVSFIVPVYNVENYLEECIHSVLDQSNDDFEIILVDDGSTDGSGRLCDNFSSSCPEKIRCVHQENRGLSHARNTGIDMSDGDYLFFLDSDDCLDNADFLRDVFYGIGTPDVIAFSWREVPDGTDKAHVLPDVSLNALHSEYKSGIQYLGDALSSNRRYPWYVWRYLFRRDFWMQNSWKFREDIKYEDIDIIYRVLLSAGSVSVRGDLVGYCYRTQRKGSTVYQVNIKTYKDMINIARKNIDYVLGMNCIDSRLKTLLCNNFSYAYYALIMNMGFISDQEQRNDLLKVLKSHKGMCRYTIDKKYFPIIALINVFGLRAASRLLGFRTIIRYRKRE